MSRGTKDKEKVIQDKLQIILSNLLRDEDNKYCVDCDAKGPRWASWNLGIFLCIRCAGIHRNLGVHISKVKSVNLDTWTPEQVAAIKEMGNSRARAVFEANVPEGFRRPQADSALEAFIRTKYEQRKYVAREWVPELHPNVACLGLDDLLPESSKARASSNVSSANAATASTSSASASASKTTLSDKSKSTSKTVSSSASARPPSAAPAPTLVTAPKPKTASSDVDLLSLDAPSSETILAAPPSVAAAAASTAPQETQDLFDGFLSDTPQTSSSLFPESGSSTAAPAASPAPKPVTKDSIMALYGNSSPAQTGNFTPPTGQFGASGAIGASPINVRGGAYGGYGQQPMPGQGMVGQPSSPYNVQAAMVAQHQQSQQLHLQQVQQQLASLKMNGSAGAASNGATLSNNLWQ